MDRDTLTTTPLASFPPPAKWDNWVELDAAAWPRRVEKRYSLVPTTCFNCEAACGLVAYVDKDTEQIRKLEGNPFHPGSRGRNCAKGPATINQVHDPDRVMYPMKRVGPRGSGQFERTTWDEVLDTFAARIRKALQEDRRTEVMYHVGRPGADGYMDRVLQAWGVDGHNSHTNVCSAAARLGYSLWTGHDRPSPDYANAKFILLISAHFETGHYFNPHAQRIIEAKQPGAKIAACDIRLSNTASMSDYWLAPHPGTEARMLLGFAHVILREGLIRPRLPRELGRLARAFLAARGVDGGFERIRRGAGEASTRATHHRSSSPRRPGSTRRRSRRSAARSARPARASRRTSGATPPAATSAAGRWRDACSSWVLLTGSVGSRGGTNPNGVNKFVAKPFAVPPAQNAWSELLYPREWPLAHHEASFLLPHLIKDGRGVIDTYFTRVYNPVWTNPDGCMWIEVLRDESLVGLHAALTPTWNETRVGPTTCCRWAWPPSATI